MRQKQGFTITELMIAVVIIGVLATLAIPTFTGYIYKARVTEASNFLGEIKQRQESYRNEFGQYCAVNGDDWGTYNPFHHPGHRPGWLGDHPRMAAARSSPGRAHSLSVRHRGRRPRRGRSERDQPRHG